MNEAPGCVSKMTPGGAALVGLMDRYLAAFMDISISLLEVQKLMYFLQAAGEPLRLRFLKAPYGPHAENLGHALRDLEGHLISGYAEGGDAPVTDLAVAPGAVRDAKAFSEAHPETYERFARVARLVEGFETPFGLELLTTVHWVATREGAEDHERILRATYAWCPKKRQFTATQIELAAERLRAEGWMKPSTCP